MIGKRYAARKRRKWLRNIIFIGLILSALFLVWRISARQSVPLKGGMSIPYISQLDYTDTVCVFQGMNKSVKSSGCGAACVSMVVQYLTGNTDQTPDTLFAWAFEKGYYYGDGLSHECLVEMAGLYGVSGRWIDNDAKQIKAALRQNKPVIAHVGPGLFTANGHYIVLRGLDENGMILVNDPSSKVRSKRSYDLNVIISQARTSASFMVCDAKIFD